MVVNYSDMQNIDKKNTDPHKKKDEILQNNEKRYESTTEWFKIVRTFFAIGKRQSLTIPRDVNCFPYEEVIVMNKAFGRYVLSLLKNYYEIIDYDELMNDFKRLVEGDL